MIWILYAHFAIGNNECKKITEVFEHVYAEIKQRESSEKIRVDHVNCKSELTTLVNDIQRQGIKVSEWHFIGYGMPYGPLFDSSEWPEAVSASEWALLKIPFSAEARAWFYMEGSATWLAPFLASRYGIICYGCDHLPQTNIPNMRAFPPGLWEKDADYNPIAALYAETFSDITVRRDECRWIRNKVLQLAPGRVLDIGCGNGALLAYLAPDIKQGVGVDVSSAAIEIAVKKNTGLTNLSFAAIDGLHLPFDDHSFDLIISMLSFRYLDWDPVLREMNRLLAPRSHILIVDMVSSPVRWWELPRMSADKFKNLWLQRKNKAFTENLHRLVSHPAWQKMLSHHPIRTHDEFIWYLHSRFPQGWMKVLNTGRRAKVMAFDSGPVGNYGGGENE